MPRTLTPKNFKDIGVAVYKKQPELAASILKILSNTHPEYTNISLIPRLFSKFCRLKNNTMQSLNGGKNESTYMKHVFIAVIIRLYNPQLLTGFHCTKMKKYLRAELAKATNTNATWISREAPIIMARLRYYEQFNEDVSNMITMLKNHN